MACFGKTKEEAYLKAMQATNFALPRKGSNVLLSIGSYQVREKISAANALSRCTVSHDSPLPPLCSAAKCC